MFIPTSCNDSFHKLPVHKIYPNLLVDTISQPLKASFQSSLFFPALLPCTKSCAHSSLLWHIPGESFVQCTFLDHIYSEYKLIKSSMVFKPVHNKGSYGNLHNVEFQSLSNLSERNFSQLEHFLQLFFVVSVFLPYLSSPIMQTLSRSQPLVSSSCSLSQWTGQLVLIVARSHLIWHRPA